MPFPIRDLIQASNARFLLGDPHATFEGVSIDTRTLKKGDLFFAIAGPRNDGHDHLQAAVEKGAAGFVLQTLDQRLQFVREDPPSVFQVPDSIAALQQWARFRRKQSRAVVIGITGTNGKTTTKQMVAAILSRVGGTLSTQGNLNNHLGLPLTLSQLEPEHRFAVLEMGASRAGDIQLLAEIGRPMIGLITNIGKAHLEGLGTPEGVLKEKRALLDSLPVDGVAVINQDDSFIMGIVPSLNCRKLYFGLTSQAEVRADAIQEEDTAVRFTLTIKGQRAVVNLPVPGRFQVANAVAAAAVAHAAGASIDQIVQGLGAFRPVAMRMQVIPHSSGALLINDAYNANPSSVRTSIASFAQGYPRRSRWLVLGDMRELGDGARSEHRDLGTWLATQPLERVYLYGRDTRFVLESLQAQAPTNMRVERFRKKKRLLEELQRALAGKPVILFKASRAMKLEDVINPLSRHALPST